MVNGLVKLNLKTSIQKQSKVAESFFVNSRERLTKIKKEISSLQLAEKNVVIWGGTGKAANFIQHYDLDDTRFP